MKFLNIEAFLAIVETHSLSKASELLHLSQSGVSHRLKSLENEIGTQLIDRKKGQRFIILTPKGEEFVSIAERWMSLWKDTSIWQNKESCYSLNIGCVDSLNARVFPPFYRKLADCTTPISLQISTHWSFVIYNLLESHEIDVGFVLRQMQSKNILIDPVFSERMVLIYFSSETRFSTKVHPKDLNVHKEIFLNWGPEYQVWHDYWWDPSKTPYTTVDTPSLIFSFLSAC